MSPAGGAKPAVSRRPATAQDDAFLFELFQAVRAPDFAHAPLSGPQLEALLRIQYAGQKQTYTLQFPDSDHDRSAGVSSHGARRAWLRPYLGKARASGAPLAAARR